MSPYPPRGKDFLAQLFDPFRARHSRLLLSIVSSNSTATARQRIRDPVVVPQPHERDQIRRQSEDVPQHVDFELVKVFVDGAVEQGFEAV